MWWQNTAATFFAVSVSGAVGVIASQLTRSVGGGIPVLVVVLGTGGYVTVRAVRIGVYESPDAIVVRGLFRTTAIPWPMVAGVSTYKLSGYSKISYMPLLLVKNGPYRFNITKEYHDMMLIWLASGSDKSARRWADRVEQMIDRHR